MCPLNYALALALLTAPDLDTDTVPLAHFWAAGTMQQVAIGMEILDFREVRYVLTREEDFRADLKLLRRRHVDLRDAPPIADAMRFPDRSLVNDLLAFNRAYRQHVENLKSIDFVNSFALRQVIIETDQLYQIWDLARDARCDYYYVTVRRQALGKLRDALGHDVYYSGFMPPHVPIWRFQRLD